MAEMSPPRRRMIEDMTIRNLSPATQQSYIHAVSKFSRHFGRSPDRLGLEDVRAYQVHLISKGVSWASLNQVVCALRFFYGVTLGCDAIPERIAYAREPRKVPTVPRMRDAHRDGGCRRLLGLPRQVEPREREFRPRRPAARSSGGLICVTLSERTLG